MLKQRCYKIKPFGSGYLFYEKLNMKLLKGDLKMKRFKLLTSAMLALSLLAACGGGNETTDTNGGSTDAPKETKQVVLKLAEVQPEDYPTTMGTKEFARLVEERTDGRYKIEVYAGGQLGDEKSTMEQVQLGSIDFVRTNANPLAEFSSDIGVFSMPYLFKNKDHMWNVLNGEIGDELLATLESSRMVGLAFYDSGERNFYNSKRPVQLPADLKGLKIRVQQSQMVIDLVEALGASATPMAYGEVYSGIQTGVIDGAENNFPSYYTTNHYEVAKYLTLNAHSAVPEVLIGSKATWDKLSDEDKEIFRQAAKDSIAVQREAWDALVQESREAVIANGSEIVEITDFTPWRDAVQSIYDKYGADFQDIIDRIDQY